MNIRPITSAPRVIAFGGEEVRATTRITKKRLMPESEARTLAKLHGLSDRQVLAVKGTTFPWYAVDFRTSKRNRINFVYWMKDGSDVIEAEYPDITIKRTGTTIKRSRQVTARPDIIAHLNRIMEKFLKRA